MVKIPYECPKCGNIMAHYGTCPQCYANDPARVYIAHDDGRFDFSDAERFGTTIAVVSQLADSADMYPDNVDEKMPGVIVEARTRLADFRPEHDYLCLVGNPVIQALCAFILGQNQQRRRQPIRVLRFDRREQSYYAVLL